jgi:hypothetical protein
MLHESEHVFCQVHRSQEAWLACYAQNKSDNWHVSPTLAQMLYDMSHACCQLRQGGRMERWGEMRAASTLWEGLGPEQPAVVPSTGIEGPATASHCAAEGPSTIQLDPLRRGATADWGYCIPSVKHERVRPR